MCQTNYLEHRCGHVRYCGIHPCKRYTITGLLCVPTHPRRGHCSSSLNPSNSRDRTLTTSPDPHQPWTLRTCVSSRRYPGTENDEHNEDHPLDAGNPYVPSIAEEAFARALDLPSHRRWRPGISFPNGPPLRLRDHSVSGPSIFDDHRFSQEASPGVEHLLQSRSELVHNAIMALLITHHHRNVLLSSTELCHECQDDTAYDGISADTLKQLAEQEALEQIDLSWKHGFIRYSMEARANPETENVIGACNKLINEVLERLRQNQIDTDGDDETIFGDTPTNGGPCDRPSNDEAAADDGNPNGNEDVSEEHVETCNGNENVSGEHLETCNDDEVYEDDGGEDIDTTMEDVV